MNDGDKSSKPPGTGEFEINPQAFDTPLNRLSGMVKNLFVKPAADALAGAAQKMADAAGTVAKAAENSAPAHSKPPESAQTAAKPARPLARSQPGQRPGTDTLLRSQPPLAGRTAPLGNGAVGGATGGSAGSAMSRSDVPQDPVALDAWLEEQAQQSDRRMTFVVKYLKAAPDDPEFQDKPLIYRIVTQERSYQQALIARLQVKIGMEKRPQEADGLKERLTQAQQRQSQLFAVLKKVTGRSGKTGGTGFLGTAPLSNPQNPESPNPPDR